MDAEQPDRAAPGASVSPDGSAYGDLLRRLRLVAGLTQEELAERFGALLVVIGDVRCLREQWDLPAGEEGGLADTTAGEQHRQRSQAQACGDRRSEGLAAEE